MATDRDPLDAIADVACPHVHHHAMCAPCAADAIRPELEHLRTEFAAMTDLHDAKHRDWQWSEAELERLRFTEKHLRAELAKSDAENNAAGRRAERAEAALERVRALDKPEVAGTRLYDPAREQADQDLGHADDCEWHEDGHSYCSCATWPAACAVAGVVMELVLAALDQPTGGASNGQ